MKFTEMTIEDFGKLVKQRFKLVEKDNKKLTKEFDIANTTYQMIDPTSSTDFGFDASVAKFVDALSQAGVVQNDTGPANVTGTESLWGALFLHSKLSITKPDCHCQASTNDWNDIQAAKFGTLFFNYLEEAIKVTDTIERTLYLDTSIFGNGILYIGWDSNGGNVKSYDPETKTLEMTGNFELRRVNPYFFYIEPNVTSLSEAKWCFEKHYMTVEELCYVFPNMVEHIKEFHRTESENHKHMGTEVKEEGIWVLEYWEKALPWNAMRGRHAVFMIASQHAPEVIHEVPRMKCLHIEDNPYKHGELPFVMLTDIDIAGSPWGLSRLVLCSPTQENIDRILSICLDNSILHGQIHLMVPDGTQNKDNLRTDDPIQVFHWNAAIANGQKPTQLNPVGVSSDFWRQYEIYKRQINSIFGAGEFSQGEIKRELSGFAVISAIDTDDKFRIRLFNKKVSVLKKMWEMLLHIGQQFLPEDMLIGLSGGSRLGAAQMFKVSDLSGNFDVKVGFGRFMPADPSAAKEYMFQLLQTGAYEKAGGDYKRIVSLLLDGGVVDFQNYWDGAFSVQENEIVRMLDGQQVPVTEEQDHMAHMNCINEFMNNMFYESLPDNLKDIVRSHKKGHMDLYAKLQAQAQPPPEAGAEGQPPQPQPTNGAPAPQSPQPPAPPKAGL